MRNWDTEQLGHLVSGNFEQADYHYWVEAGEEALDSEPTKAAAKTELAKRLEDEITEGMPETVEPYNS